MKKYLSFVLALALMVLPLFSTGCATQEDVIYLDVYNWEDYICIDDDADLIEEFENRLSVEVIKDVDGLVKKTIVDLMDKLSKLENADDNLNNNIINLKEKIDKVKSDISKSIALTT